MYDEDVDFYSLDNAKQRHLIHNKRVATTGELLTDVPEGQPAVRVFTKSLEQLILDVLERGQYTISDLADHFGVRTTDIRRILNKYRRRGADHFTAENFKQYLLIDRHGILRGVNADGRSLYYSLETVPFFARVVDPTLGFSLLDFQERLADFPRVIDFIPSGKATELDEDYAFVVGEYWGIDPKEVFDYLTEHDREYIDTSLLPLPKVTAPNEYSRVADRFKQVDHVYKMFRVDPEDVEDIGSDFLTRFELNQAGVADYQIISIHLADLRWHAHCTNDSDLQEVTQNWMDEVAATLHPDRTPTDTGDDVDTSLISLRDEIQLVLSETPVTPSEVLESLPRDVQLATDESEVTETLDRLSNTGVISKRSGVSEYFVEEDNNSWK